MSQHAGKFTRSLAYQEQVSVRALRRCFRNKSGRQRRHLYQHPEVLVQIVRAGETARQRNQLKAKVRAGTRLSHGQGKLAQAWARARKILTNEKKGGRKKS